MNEVDPPDPYAAPRQESSSAEAMRHTRLGLASLAVAVLGWAALFAGCALSVVTMWKGSPDESEMGWDGWGALVESVWLVAIVSGPLSLLLGLVGGLRYWRRRWTAVLGMTVGCALCVAFFVMFVFAVFAA